MANLPPIDTSPENLAYLKTLKPGEKVIELGQCCTKGCKGVVYKNEFGDLCVRWKLGKTILGTTVTWGTRRLSDLPPEQNPR